MDFGLTSHQKDYQAEFQAFTEEELIPHANRFDREQKLPVELIRKMAKKGYLGAILPKEAGGMGVDWITFGLLNEEIGRGCASTRGVLAVHSMVSFAIARWGSDKQKEHWLPGMASGELLGAFALSEPEIGSDGKSVKTEAVRLGNDFILNGRKKWITFGGIADVLLVFAHCEGKNAAFLVEQSNPGLSTELIQNMLGTRAAMLSYVDFKDCQVSEENLLGRVGSGFSPIALSALDVGRFSAATACVGMIQTCVNCSLEYAGKRKQYGEFLKNHQLIRKMLADMITNLKAARFLCYHAGYLLDTGNRKASKEVMAAKYFASKVCCDAARDAVQIHGGNGLSHDYVVERFYRDAKIMEVIEGSNEMNQLVLGKKAAL